MKFQFLLAFLLSSTASLLLAEDHDHADHDHGHGKEAMVECEPGTSSGFLFPSLHAYGVFGASTGDQADLAISDHDPQRAATLQTLEPGLGMRLGSLIGFATASAITDASGDFSIALEEAFLQLNDLPLGLSLRGGQYLNQVGFQNQRHNHSWDFIDQNLVNGRFLNEGELITQGGEINWAVPISHVESSVLSVSVGGVAGHDHGHSEEGHLEESEFEGEGATFADQVVTANWMNTYRVGENRRITSVLSGAWGDNEFGRTTQVYGMGLDVELTESLSWRTEVMYRSVGAVSGEIHGDGAHDHEEEHHDEAEGHGEAHHEDEDHDDAPRRATLDEFGAYTALTYAMNDRFEAGLRGEWISGIDAAGLDSRWRVSPALTWRSQNDRLLQARIQYNFDHSNDFGSEHSVWFQLGFNWDSANHAFHNH